jgi:hypothetical protein
MPPEGVLGNQQGMVGAPEMPQEGMTDYALAAKALRPKCRALRKLQHHQCHPDSSQRSAIRLNSNQINTPTIGKSRPMRAHLVGLKY